MSGRRRWRWNPWCVCRPVVGSAKGFVRVATKKLEVTDTQRAGPVAVDRVDELCSRGNIGNNTRPWRYEYVSSCCARRGTWYSSFIGLESASAKNQRRTQLTCPRRRLIFDEGRPEIDRIRWNRARVAQHIWVYACNSTECGIPIDLADESIPSAVAPRHRDDTTRDECNTTRALAAKIEQAEDKTMSVTAAN